jgi:hypothetical protein
MRKTHQGMAVAMIRGVAGVYHEDPKMPKLNPHLFLWFVHRIFCLFLRCMHIIEFGSFTDEVLL